MSRCTAWHALVRAALQLVLLLVGGEPVLRERSSARPTYASDQTQRGHATHSASSFIFPHPETSGASGRHRTPGRPHEESLGVDGPAHLQDMRGPAWLLHVHVKGTVSEPETKRPFSLCDPILVERVTEADRVLFEHDASLMASHGALQSARSVTRPSPRIAAGTQ